MYGDELTNFVFSSPFPYFGSNDNSDDLDFQYFWSPSHVHAYVARIFPKSIMISIQGDHYAILSFAVRRTALKNKMGLRSHFVNLVSRSEGPLFPKIIAKYRINQALNGLIYALRAIWCPFKDIKSRYLVSRSEGPLLSQSPVLRTLDFGCTGRRPVRIPSECSTRFARNKSPFYRMEKIQSDLCKWEWAKRIRTPPS